jgi:hypothetical protein
MGLEVILAISSQRSPKNWKHPEEYSLNKVLSQDVFHRERISKQAVVI